MDATPVEPEVVIEDPRIERGRMMYADMPYEEGPQFRITETAKFFFGRTDNWMRWLSKVEKGGEERTKGGKVFYRKPKPNYLLYEGREYGNRRSDNGLRVFGLRDIEEMAYVLAKQGRIDGEQLRHTLVALDTVGRIWKVREREWH